MNCGKVGKVLRDLPKVGGGTLPYLMFDPQEEQYSAYLPSAGKVPAVR